MTYPPNPRSWLSDLLPLTTKQTLRYPPSGRQRPESQRDLTSGPKEVQGDKFKAKHPGIVDWTPVTWQWGPGKLPYDSGPQFSQEQEGLVRCCLGSGCKILTCGIPFHPFKQHTHFMITYPTQTWKLPVHTLSSPLDSLFPQGRRRPGLLTFAPLGPSNRSRYTTGKAAELCLNSQNCKLHHRCCRLDVMCLLRVHMQSLDSPGSWYKDTLWPFKVRIQGEVIMQVLQGYY